MSEPLDLDFVRAQFPALAGNGVFFDNAGGSQTLTGVVDRIADYLLTSNVQHGATYAASRRAAERLREATADVAELIGARRPEEVVMGPSTTALLQMLSAALAERIQPGDEIIVTDCDHESNIGPWFKLRERGAVIKVWPTDPDSFELDLDGLRGLMSPRTKLVCCTHVSNIFGTINPVAEITRLVHERGARVVVDGVAYAPHRLVDVAAWDVDFYVFSFYKVYGPHHALLYGQHAQLLELPSLSHYFIGRERVPYKLQPGNVNYELSFGCGGIVDYLADLGRRLGAAGDRRAGLERAFDAIAAHEEELSERLLDYLRARNDVSIIGRREAARDRRVPTISFVLDGHSSASVVDRADRSDIGIRYGDFYSKRLIDKLKLSVKAGVVRVSMVHYNTLAEVDRLIQVLEEVRSGA